MMKLKGMQILMDSVVTDGVDRSDYPDFCDAYFSFARFADGSALSDEELAALTDKYPDILHARVLEEFY